MVNLKLFQERKMPMDRDAQKIITNEIRGGRLYLCKVRKKSVKGRGGGGMGHRNLLATSFFNDLAQMKSQKSDKSFINDREKEEYPSTVP